MNIIFAILLLLLPSFVYSAEVEISSSSIVPADYTAILINDFVNNSKFKPKYWDIGKEIAQWLARRIAENKNYRVYRQDSDISQGQEGGIITGKIEEFVIHQVGGGMLPAFRHDLYQTKIKISYSMTITDKTPFAAEVVKEKTYNKTKAFEFENEIFLIGPMDAEEESNDAVFDSGKRMKLSWNSDLFRQSIVGKACQEIVDEMYYKIDKWLEQGIALRGEIVRIDDKGVYINLGKDDGIKTDDVFMVWGITKSSATTGTVVSENIVGKIKIVFIRDKHSALAEVIEGKVSEYDRIKKQ